MRVKNEGMLLIGQTMTAGESVPFVVFSRLDLQSNPPSSQQRPRSRIRAVQSSHLPHGQISENQKAKCSSQINRTSNITQKQRTFAFRITLHSGPIHTIRINFSLCDSLSFAYVTRTYAKDARLSCRTSRSSVRPPVPVCVTVSLSERSVWWT
jgi:hypothetical protein